MTLSTDILKQLQAPFPATEIKLKIQAMLKSKKDTAIVVAYIDARNVMERLDEVVGGDWSDSYDNVTLAGKAGTQCNLTVLGVTRSDIGDPASDGMDDSLKSSYSDAFKRAAVKFGIGRFLYALPKMYAETEGEGKAARIKKSEIERLNNVIRNHVANIAVGKIMASEDDGEPMERVWSLDQMEAVVSAIKDATNEDVEHEEVKAILNLSVLSDDVPVKTIQSWFKHYLNSQGATPLLKAADANEAYQKAKSKTGGK